MSQSVVNVVGMMGLLVFGNSGCGSDSETATPGSAGAGAGGEAGSGAGASGAPGTGGAAGTQADGGSDDWQILIEGEWTLAPGTEKYVCVRKTLSADIELAGFEPIHPRGTHHTFLTGGSGLVPGTPPDQPDGTAECADPFEQLPWVIGGGGVGTGRFELPEGTALHLSSGMQLLLNLHLFNTSTETLSGTSGVRIRAVPADSVVNTAMNTFVGPTTLDLPAHQTTTVDYLARINGHTRILGVLPHMHQLGSHARVVAQTAAAGDVILRDGPFSFDDQRIYPADLPLEKNDQIRTSCTFQNDTDAPVGFGESSHDEMCFVGLILSPLVSITAP